MSSFYNITPDNTTGQMSADDNGQTLKCKTWSLFSQAPGLILL